MSVFSDVIALKDAVKTGDRSAIWAAFVVLGDNVFGPHPHPVMECPPPGEDVVAAVNELRCCCEEKLAVHAAGGEAVGKIGDGTILRLIIQYLPAILALFGK